MPAGRVSEEEFAQCTGGQRISYKIEPQLSTQMQVH